ncbi:MAG: type II toxin-antitoxin system ParD family antitoxin [Spirochaetia bacterium]|jgi:putative addiction module CopG family antidote|nr:type II toxin-antitoxin system ParD family antitoxin [Spirochaetia bacterium]
MPRINLGEPYEIYIQKQIKTGLFSSATEVIKDALRNRMEREKDYQTEQWIKIR